MTTVDACPDRATLSQLVDGELSPTLTATTHRHVGACSHCRPLVAALERAADAGRMAVRRQSAAPSSAPPAADACLAPEDLAGCAARALSDDDLRRAETHLAHCDACLLATREALATMHALTSAPLEVPASLRARVASQWPESSATITRLAIEIGRTGLRLLAQHLALPVLSIEPQLVPLAVHRAGEDAAALTIRLAAENGEIRATLVPEDGAVGVTLLLLGSEGAPLSGQRLYLRQHGSAIFSARTDASGELRLPRMEPGVYDVACPGIDTTFRLDLHG